LTRDDITVREFLEAVKRSVSEGRKGVKDGGSHFFEEIRAEVKLTTDAFTAHTLDASAKFKDESSADYFVSDGHGEIADVTAEQFAERFGSYFVSVCYWFAGLGSPQYYLRVRRPGEGAGMSDASVLMWASHMVKEAATTLGLFDACRDRTNSLWSSAYSLITALLEVDCELIRTARGIANQGVSGDEKPNELDVEEVSELVLDRGRELAASQLYMMKARGFEKKPSEREKGEPLVEWNASEGVKQ
jgi:hypothetical protein